MTTQTDFRTRQSEINDIHRQYKTVYQLLGGALLVLLGVWIGANLFANDSGYATN